MNVKNYKDFEIEVDFSGNFSADGVDKTFDTLKALEDEINRVSKIEYAPLDGFVLYNEQVKMVKITRPHDARGVFNSAQSYWITHVESKRKETTSRVYLATPENLALAEKYRESVETSFQLSKERELLTEQMKQVPIALEQVKKGKKA